MSRAKENARRRINELFEDGRPVIVVFREKHCDPKHACLDRNEFERLCLTAVWERYHRGYYEAYPEPSPPPLSKEQVAAMPDSDTKRAAQAEWEHHASATGWHRESLEILGLAETALRDRDGAIAFLVLDARSDAEYEGFEFETSPAIDEPPSNLLGIAPEYV